MDTLNRVCAHSWGHPTCHTHCTQIVPLKVASSQPHGLWAPESACGRLTGSFTSPEGLVAPQASPPAHAAEPSAPASAFLSDSHPPSRGTRGGVAACHLLGARVNAATADGQMASRSFPMPGAWRTEAEGVGTGVWPASPRGCAELGAGGEGRARTGRDVGVWACTRAHACTEFPRASSGEAPH